MQLKLDRIEKKRGILFKKMEYKVETQLVCNEEELAAVKTLGLIDRNFVESYQVEGMMSDFGQRPVKAWVKKGLTFPAEDIPHAKSLEAEITDIAMVIKEQVESFLDGGGETESSRVIDL